MNPDRYEGAGTVRRSSGYRSALLTTAVLCLYVMAVHADNDCHEHMITDKKEQLPTQGWNLKRDRSGLLIYNRAIAGSDVREVVALSEIPV